MSTMLTRLAKAMPMTFTAVVKTMKPTIHSQAGTDGKAEVR